MVIFYLVNALFFILLVTKCCWMNEEKRYKVCRGIEQMFGIPERPLVTNIKHLDEKELDEYFKENTENNEESNELAESTMPEENTERKEQFEKAKEIVESLKNELSKKVD